MFKNKILVVFLIFLVVGLIIYANSFNNAFFWDDDDSIVNNAYIKDWKHAGKFFSKNLIDGAGQTTNYWRPLVLASFSLDYHVWGLMPAGFHLTNTFLHIISAFLLFLFLYNLFEQSRDDGQVEAKNFFVVFLVSLFFLVHPLQTEAVTYVAGRADSLSTVFSLLSLIFYIYYRKGAGKQTGKYIISIVFFILGLLTKEQVILLPLLILLVELTVFTKKFNKKSIFEAIRRTGLFFAISVFYFISRITVLNFKESCFYF